MKFHILKIKHIESSLPAHTRCLPWPSYDFLRFATSGQRGAVFGRMASQRCQSQAVVLRVQGTGNLGTSLSSYRE